jgi:hypothetical protein
MHMDKLFLNSLTSEKYNKIVEHFYVFTYLTFFIHLIKEIVL